MQITTFIELMVRIFGTNWDKNRPFWPKNGPFWDRFGQFWDFTFAMPGGYNKGINN